MKKKNELEVSGPSTVKNWVSRGLTWQVLRRWTLPGKAGTNPFKRSVNIQCTQKKSGQVVDTINFVFFSFNILCLWVTWVIRVWLRFTGGSRSLVSSFNHRDSACYPARNFEASSCQTAKITCHQALKTVIIRRLYLCCDMGRNVTFPELAPAALVYDDSEPISLLSERFNVYLII